MITDNSMKQLATAIRASQTTAFNSHISRIGDNRDEYKSNATDVTTALQQLSEAAINEAEELLSEEKVNQQAFLDGLKAEVVQLMDGSHGFDGFNQMAEFITAEKVAFSDFIQEQNAIIDEALTAIGEDIGLNYNFIDQFKI
tara:strand:- start:198 stop:623 length:426 start_codon:yes stop_codon:yes gene_type:complete